MIPEGYKKTDIGLIPEEWEVKTIKELTIGKLTYGINAPAVPYAPPLPNYIRITDISDDGYFIKTNRTSIESNDIHQYVLEKGDILFARTGASTGKTYLYRIEDGVLVYAGFLIKASINQEIADSKYVFYTLHTHRYWNWVTVTSMRSGQPGINGNEYSAFKIPFPQLIEQKNIAEALSDVDELIASLEKLIEKKKALKQGVMHELLTGKRRLPQFKEEWKKYRVGEIGEFYNGLSGKRKTDFDQGNAKYITFLNVLSNVIIDSSILGIVNINSTETQNLVKNGDLFFNTSSETPEEVGMCAVLLSQLDNTYLNSFCFGFRLKNESHDPLFLSYYFNSFIGRKIMRLLAQGATRYNLSKNSFSNIVLKLPNKEEQSSLAQIFNNFDNEIKALEKKLEKTIKLKSGMMSELLTGKKRLI